jgi:osmotically inducible lipoprotein OsmB
MRLMKYLTVVLLAAFSFGCAGMSRQQQSTLSGGAIGAGGGALLGGVSGGSPAVGAVLGGAAGALTGYILGDQGDGRDGRRHHRRDY